jgi:hypothetical protein
VVFTRDLLTMLIGLGRQLARSGISLRIEDPDQALPVRLDGAGRLLPRGGGRPAS